ncbi:MAG: hypothetical protein Q8P04_00575 [bacterium]|nr:hypothetical protein [bacterium]
MNLLKGSVGLAAIVLIFMAAFYAYSNLPGKNGSPATETATVVDVFNNGSLPGRASEKIAKSSEATTTKNRPSLDGLNESQLQEGLNSIKAGLDLLENPFE